MELDFTELGLDVIGGTALAGLGYVIENTLTAADVAAGAMTAAQATFYGEIVFGLVLAGAIFTRIGSGLWKKSRPAATATS